MIVADLSSSHSRSVMTEAVITLVLLDAIIDASLRIVESVARVGVVTVHLLYFLVFLLLCDRSKLECRTSTDWLPR